LIFVMNVVRLNWPAYKKKVKQTNHLFRKEIQKWHLRHQKGYCFFKTGKVKCDKQCIFVVESIAVSTLQRSTEKYKFVFIDVPTLINFSSLFKTSLFISISRRVGWFEWFFFLCTRSLFFGIRPTTPITRVKLLT